MFIPHSDSVFQVDPGTTPDYNSANPLLGVMGMMERVRLAAEREQYLMDDVQYLFPVDFLELYGPAGADSGILDPTKQDNKTDFQKQNVRRLTATDTYLVRGWATTGDWTGPFLQFSYRAGVDSALSRAAGHQLSDRIKLYIRVNGVAPPALIDVPYNPESGRYEVEFWAYPGDDLASKLGDRGRAALERGALQVRRDVVQGNAADFRREVLDGQLVTQTASNNTMHPVLPLSVETAIANEAGLIWDSKAGQNYHYQFRMLVRGWEQFLGVGISPNPHGGVGFLEYRNLFSNYGRYAGMGELARSLEPWNFDAFGNKHPQGGNEGFFSVDYMDLHLLNGGCGIGLHRHRDNQEVFLMMEGRAFMVVGDWCQMPYRERCLEVRTLQSGQLAMLKGGNLHGLMNATDSKISLFMFGGYD